MTRFFPGRDGSVFRSQRTDEFPTLFICIKNQWLVESGAQISAFSRSAFEQAALLPKIRVSTVLFGTGHDRMTNGTDASWQASIAFGRNEIEEDWPEMPPPHSRSRNMLFSELSGSSPSLISLKV